MKKLIQQPIKKIVLAYSGGLDTSVILHWLRENYKCEIVTFTADIGQGEDLEQVKQKAQQAGVKEIYIENLAEEFARDYIFPMFRANTLYEGKYLLGTSIARPLIAKTQIDIAQETGADAVAHGATGKGNDQVRFELGYYANQPDIKVIAPWRHWDLNSRTKLLAYASSKGIDIPKSKLSDVPAYSMDGNLLHISFEGNDLEDPWNKPCDDMCAMTIVPQKATDIEEQIEIEFLKGDPIAINGIKLSPAKLMENLNQLGKKHGIGRIDIVENRFIGMKSRGVYETPGGSILLEAHRAMESITLDREATHLKDEIMPKYAKLIYNGFWFSKERQMLQALIDNSQEMVSGIVRLILYKGNVIVTGRKSMNSLYSEELTTFEADEIYNQQDAEGFIKLNALRLRIGSNINNRNSN